MTLLRQRNDQIEELTPAPYNVRTRVHEYGGGAYSVDAQQIIFSNFSDNQLYRIHQTGELQRITDGDTLLRYADFNLDPTRQRLIGICEDHHQSSLQPQNTICALALDGSGQRTILLQGEDFYAAPRLSPDGQHLAWLSWNHPDMPWQGTRLWLAEVAADGSLRTPQCIAGSQHESVGQPTWSPDGVLYFVSDRSDWWNIYRYVQGACQCVHARAAEFGAPHWSFDQSMFAFINANEIICTWLDQGSSHLGQLDLASGILSDIACSYSDIPALRVGPAFIFMVAAASDQAASAVRLDWRSGKVQVLAKGMDQLPTSRYLSTPQTLRYPSEGRMAHAFYYPPKNDDCQAPAGSLPPLIVIGHGGPTGMATRSFKMAIQYWTSRGFAMLDVNYGGSAGFGRAYRDTLKGQWGVVDVQDCVNGARYLVGQGAVNPEQLIIRGGSAGGFTTLSALMFYDVFQTGACYYGVADLSSLDLDSHKFESHYNQYLIAPPPAHTALYQQRSPSNHVDKLCRPMIFFQGQDDKVVPPSQSENMVQALRERHIPVAYLAFDGEGHGFRQAANIQRTLEAEHYFYCKIFNLPLPPEVSPITIENLAWPCFAARPRHSHWNCIDWQSQCKFHHKLTK